MNQRDLKRILDAHVEWLRTNGDKGTQANLGSADLRSADLGSANLRYADLGSADLRYADLGSADLRSADLGSANLRSANLGSANLRSADHDDATLWPAFLIVPDTGSFTGWKKLKDGVIAKLEIPAKAQRTGGLTERKCRAEFVKTVALFGGDTGLSMHDGVTKYVVGKVTKPDHYDPDFTITCSAGIHFYITRAEAEAHL